MQRHVWHYLYNSSTGKTPTTRIDEQHICVSLPNTLTGTTENYILAVDGRDQRTLLAFDGHLSLQALPAVTMRSSTQHLLEH